MKPEREIKIPEIHPFLSKKELDIISRFTEKLAYKPLNTVLPQIYEWVKMGVVNKHESILLITYYYDIHSTKRSRKREKN